MDAKKVKTSRKLRQFKVCCFKLTYEERKPGTIILGTFYNDTG